MAENYRRVFMGFPSSSRGQFKVELLESAAINSDGTNIGLLWCEYIIDTLRSRNMVKEGCLEHPISEEQYIFLASLNKHKNALVVENYFRNESKNGCLVVQTISGTFQSWLNHQVKMNVDLVTDDGRIMPPLRTIILSLCSFVFHVLCQRWYPENLTMDDLFIKMVNGEPTLKILLSDVRKGLTKTRVDSLWKQVKDIINHCCTLKEARLLSVDTRSFCDFIGRHTKKFPLESYPDSWTDGDKIAYLRLIMKADNNLMIQLVEDSGIVWPTEHGGAIEPILKQIMAHGENVKYDYNISVPWHYVRLSRNVTKSFDVPENLKAMLKDEIGFLRKMEEWTPTIWTDLYETIGPLELK